MTAWRDRHFCDQRSAGRSGRQEPHDAETDGGRRKVRKQDAHHPAGFMRCGAWATWRRNDVLKLTRKKGQSIAIADKITVTVVRIAGDRVSLGIEAPKAVPVRRGELPPRDAEKGEGAA